jgi:N-acetylglucosaminyl-diphospho-decaprenol L-rhamnosyltransferase
MTGTTAAAPRVTAIVVTWNSAGVITECLESLRDSVIPGGVETIVVDNGSSDATAEIVARDFPSVTLIRRPDNPGFARANNQAMATARGHALLLLNPDVVLTDPTAVARMLAVLDGERTIGLVGCRLVNRDGTHQVGDAGFRPSPFNMVCHGLGIGHLLRGVSTLYLVRPDRFRDELTDVDWVCGACLLVRSEVVEAVGGMDEGLFLYAEDIEWGCRIRSHGLRSAYLPRLRVVHLQGTSEAQAAALAEGAIVSTRWLGSLLDLYSRLNHGRWLGLVRVSFAVGFGFRAAVYRFLAILRPRRRAHYARKSTALTAYARAAAGIS